MTTTLKRSNNRKVAVDPKVANSFGLPAGPEFSCPGATSICEKICYAKKIERIYKGVSGVMHHNWDALQACNSIGEMGVLIWDMLDEFVAECDKRGVEKKFRIHWNGDFFSIDYAKAWASVAILFPEVQFWVYTRSFTDKLNVIPFIANIPNLSVYLSVDSENESFVKEITNVYSSVRIASLADTFDNARAIAKRHSSLSTPNCPELTKALPLVNACVSCGLCVFGRNNVSFSLSRR